MNVRRCFNTQCKSFILNGLSFCAGFFEREQSFHGLGHLAMGGCQSSTGSGDEALNTQTANYSDISILKLKNNNVTTAPSLEKKPCLQENYLKEHITHINLLTLSALPHNLDRHEWIAFNTISFFQNITLLSSALSEFCTLTTCPTARGPGNKVYEWTDELGKKLKCSAPLYTDCTMSYVQELLTDESVFPTRADAQFPNGYIFLVEKIFVLLFRTLAHLYSVHYRDAVAMEIHPHLNTLFTHFITFSHTFRLLEPSETAPLEDLITVLTE